MAITIDRLSGGNTPADGSDPRTFPAIWNATAAILEANVGEGGGGSITVSPTPPTDPAPENGNLWWNSTEGEMYIYYVDGSSSQWVAAAGPSVTVSATAPTGYEGQLWLDSTDGSMYTYYTDPGGANAQWIGAVSRSGGILQVVSTTKTDTFSASLAANTFSSNVTGLEASITPRSTSSKILVCIDVTGCRSDSKAELGIRLMRDSTPIGLADAAGARILLSKSGGNRDTQVASMGNAAGQHLDEPSTVSSITYGVQLYNTSSVTASLLVNRSAGDVDNVSYTRTTSTITLMEVAG